MRHAYRVLTANDGTGAVALYVQRQADIQVVVTDMAMPVMDGAATVRVLRQLNPQLKIIVISGVTSNVKLTQIADLSVQAFLPKPFTAEQLLATLQQVLRGDGTRCEVDV